MTICLTTLQIQKITSETCDKIVMVKNMCDFQATKKISGFFGNVIYPMSTIMCLILSPRMSPQHVVTKFVDTKSLQNSLTPGPHKIFQLFKREGERTLCWVTENFSASIQYISYTVSEWRLSSNHAVVAGWRQGTIGY